MGHSPCYSQSEVVYSCQVLNLAPMVSLAKIPYFFFGGFFCYHGNHFAKFLAHVLSWVKTYHAEFQRNPPTGLAGMMVQTDMPPGIKPSQGGSPPSLKVWSKSNRDFEKRKNIVTQVFNIYIYIYIDFIAFFRFFTNFIQS